VWRHTGGSLAGILAVCPDTAALKKPPSDAGGFFGEFGFFTGYDASLPPPAVSEKQKNKKRNIG
jgi:hypothetical protein